MQAIDPKGSFTKNLLLSLLLIGVTSLLIPIVLKQIDDRKAMDQQRAQDELSRQDTVLDAQATLIDTMAADFWQYEFYASDLIISRDPRFGDARWHERAVENYYEHSGPLLGTMRAEVSTLLRLAPRSTYQEFRTFYEQEIVPLDACLLALLKQERAATPLASVATPGPGNAAPAACDEAAGPYAGSTWDTLAEAVVANDLAGGLDQQFANLARAFRLAGAAD